MGGRRALIVAVDEYRHEALQRLRAPSADAQALAGVLGDPAVGGFDVDIIHNETSHDIGVRVEDLFAESRPDDLLFVHFSCHGLKSESGELFFAAIDTRPDRLGSTALPAAFLQRCLTASRARNVVLLLDCCYGGAFGQGVAVRASGSAHVLDSFPAAPGGGRSRAVITASNAMEYAFEGSELTDDHQQPPSLFTAAVVQGLETGEADRDEDGWVSLNELYDYVYDAVRERNPHQTPSRDIEMQGELYLARSGRQRLMPAPVPDEVREALTDPNMFTRLGAVAELRGRLLGGDVAVALGAHEVLSELVRTGVSYLADAARAALGEAALQVQESELAFGDVALGSGVPEQRVHVSGPPLALVCTFAASDAWLRVEPDDGGARVSVHPTEPGLLRGRLTITAPTGEVVVPVTATGTDAVRRAEPEAPRVVEQRAVTPLRPPSDADVAAAAAPRRPSASGPQESVASAPVRDSATPAVPWKRTGWGVVGLGAVAFLGMFLPFQWGSSLPDQESYATYAFTTTSLAALVGGAVLLRTRAPVGVGSGILFVVGAAASWNLGWLLLYVGDEGLDGLGVGYLVELLTHATVVGVALFVAVRLANAAQVSVARPSGRDWSGWALLVSGAVGVFAMVLLAAVVRLGGTGAVLLTLWGAALTAVVLGLAATLRPTRMAAAMHGTWVVCGFGIAATYQSRYFFYYRAPGVETMETYYWSLVLVTLLLPWRLWVAWRSTGREGA